MGLNRRLEQIAQLAWLYRLWKLNPSKSEIEKRELDTMVDFVPYYAIGNVCIGGRRKVLMTGSISIADACSLDVLLEFQQSTSLECVCHH